MAVTTETDRSRVEEGHPLEVRKVSFDWSHTPLHWVPGDPFSTHFGNVLHLLLPAGERWFIDVVREAQPLVEDAELREAIKPFIGQEAWHARAHAVVLEHLADQGIDTAPYTDRLDAWFHQFLGPHDSWPAPVREWWLRRRLAVVAGIEHYTCVLGNWVLENTGLEEAGADPMMLDLLRWHGSEEVEHRSLVFDVHAAVGGRYSQRVTTMLEAAAGLFAWWVVGIRYLMAHDPTLDGAKPSWGDWLRAAGQARVPGPGILLSVLRYIRPGHHPSTEVPTEVGLNYLARSPAVQAAAAAAA